MIHRYIIILLTVSSIALFSGCAEEQTSTTAAPAKSTAVAKPAAKPVPKPVAKAEEEKVEAKFVYQVQDRRDPFMPLVTKKKKDNDAAQSEEALTPLQKFNLNQYRLIGVIIGKGEPRAMVKSPDGKSYILKKGVKIGKNNGVIVEIGNKAIVVEETYNDLSGNVRTNMQQIQVPKRKGV